MVSSSGMVVLISHDADENGEDGPATVENGKLSRSSHKMASLNQQERHHNFFLCLDFYKLMESDEWGEGEVIFSGGLKILLVTRP